MIVLTLEYWPGGDYTRSQRQGWIAALKVATAAGAPPWLVVASLGGRRSAYRVEATTALAAATAVLTRLHPDPRVRAQLTAEPEHLGHVTATVEAAHAPAERWIAAPVPAVVTRRPQPGQRRGIRTRLLQLDLLTESEVRALFGYARDQAAITRGLRKAGVVIAVRDERQLLYPAFQFRGARPHPIVAAVNLLLRADEDPWAAATWWVRSHPMLGVRPLDLLSQADQVDRLLTAARLRPRG